MINLIFYSWVNSRCNLCFTIFICWRYRPLHLLRRIFKVLFCCFFFCSFEPNDIAVFYMCCLQYPHTVYDNRNLWIYSFCLLWLKGKPDCKLFHVLYLTWQNLISSNSFSLGITAVTFEHLTFDFLCDLVEQYTVFTKLISLCYPCFLAAQSQYIVWISLSILTYLFWFIIWLKVNQMYFIYITRIILQYFCSWSLLCVPSLTVW